MVAKMDVNMVYLMVERKVDMKVLLSAVLKDLLWVESMVEKRVVLWENAAALKTAAKRGYFHLLLQIKYH